jgi:hypothetical protein
VTARSLKLVIAMETRGLDEDVEGATPRTDVSGFGVTSRAASDRLTTRRSI